MDFPQSRDSTQRSPFTIPRGSGGGLGASGRSRCFRIRMMTNGCSMKDMTFICPPHFGHFKASTFQTFFRRAAHNCLIPCASAELVQKLPVMQKMKPEHFRNTPSPVSVMERSLWGSSLRTNSSGICVILFSALQGVRAPLRPTGFSVYASAILFAITR